MQKRDFEKDVKGLYEDFKNAKKINESNLFKILNDNKDTVFGKKYNFSNISSIKEYQNSVPLTTYNEYTDGNEYAYDVGYHLATSGTLGNQKKFTVSKLAMELYGGYNFEMPFYLLNMNTEKGINISTFKNPEEETLLSCALYDYLRKNGYYDEKDFYDHEFLFVDTNKNIFYIKMYIALAHKDVTYFDSIFLYDLLNSFKYLQENWQLLLNDIKNKTFSVSISKEEQEILLRQEFSKERIDEIERIFNEGFDEPIIKKLFPDLRFVSGVGGGKYEVYDKGLREFIGDVDIYYYIYAQTECTMGVPLEMNKAYYAMMPKTCFYEYRDVITEEIKLPHELEIGKEYEPIVTTFSGLYRYHTGDKIKMIEYIYDTPVIMVRGRINSVINIAGEKVDDADISLTMEKLKEKYRFNQFAVGVDKRVYPNRYILFVEANEIEDSFAIDFDESLRSISFDYDELRDRDSINQPIAKIINTKEFASIQKGQIKPKVVIDDKIVERWINEQ